jgi:hypothetical protein
MGSHYEPENDELEDSDHEESEEEYSQSGEYTRTVNPQTYEDILRLQKHVRTAFSDTSDEFWDIISWWDDYENSDNDDARLVKLVRAITHIDMIRDRSIDIRPAIRSMLVHVLIWLDQEERFRPDSHYAELRERPIREAKAEEERKIREEADLERRRERLKGFSRAMEEAAIKTWTEQGLEPPEPLVVSPPKPKRKRSQGIKGMVLGKEPWPTHPPPPIKPPETS